jgi:hypothetical protein
MDKSIKFPAIFFFIFLISITKVVASIPPMIFTDTSVRCRKSDDCAQALYRPTNVYLTIYLCDNGYCVEGKANPKYIESIK